MGKLLEKLIKNRIMMILETNSYLDYNQHHFREGRGVTTAFSSLLSKTEILRIQFKYISFISLDIMGAFDSINWDILCEVINESILPKYLKILLKNYLVKRKVGAKMIHGIVWSSLSRGCSQGSYIGLLLWLLIADLIYTDSETSFKVLQRLFPQNEIIKQMYEKIRKMPEKMIHIKWTKAHIGTTGNERADYLAKQVIQEIIFDYQIALRYPGAYRAGQSGLSL